MPPVPIPFLPTTLTLSTPLESTYSIRSVANPSFFRTYFKYTQMAALEEELTVGNATSSLVY